MPTQQHPYSSICAASAACIGFAKKVPRQWKLFVRVAAQRRLVALQDLLFWLSWHCGWGSSLQFCFCLSAVLEVSVGYLDWRWFCQVVFLFGVAATHDGSFVPALVLPMTPRLLGEALPPWKIYKIRIISKFRWISTNHDGACLGPTRLQRTAARSRQLREALKLEKLHCTAALNLAQFNLA